MPIQYQDPENAQEWSALANLRYREADCLMGEKFYNGAEYLYGHSVEAALKGLCFLVNGQYSKGHRLKVLAEKALFQPIDMSDDLGYLDDRSVNSRYGMSCSNEFASKAQRCARQIMDYVADRAYANNMRRNLGEQA